MGPRASTPHHLNPYPTRGSSPGLQIWDLGGQQNLRPFWGTYFKGTDAVIMVVDSTDRARVGVTKVGKITSDIPHAVGRERAARGEWEGAARPRDWPLGALPLGRRELGAVWLTVVRLGARVVVIMVVDSTDRARVGVTKVGRLAFII